MGFPSGREFLFFCNSLTTLRVRWGLYVTCPPLLFLVYSPHYRDNLIPCYIILLDLSSMYHLLRPRSSPIFDGLSSHVNISLPIRIFDELNSQNGQKSYPDFGFSVPQSPVNLSCILPSHSVPVVTQTSSLPVITPPP